MSPLVPPVNDVPFAPQPIAPGRPARFFRKLLFPSSSTSPSPAPPDSGDEHHHPSSSSLSALNSSFSAAASPSKTGLIRRMSRRVVPSLSRQQTFKRQQSERREYLAPVAQTADERRAASVDRRSQRTSGRSSSHAYHSVVRSSAPSLMSGDGRPETASAPTLVNARHMFTIEDVSREYIASPAPEGVLSPGRDLDPCSSYEDQIQIQGRGHVQAQLQNQAQVQNQVQKGHAQVAAASAAAEEEDVDDDDDDDDDEVFADAPQAMTESEYEEMIHEELERTWILNLSMHFRDRSKREKFFVTYRQQEHLWRRVTVSLDYREAPLYSLEHELLTTKSQKDKSARIYDAIRESLPDIQFYDTVTNLKLETTDGRLHVHVVEDGNEIIHFPTVNQIRYLGCKRIKERDIEFVSHMSGFVYKVQVHGLELIKKEIPSPDTIDEFLYEVNALNTLRFSDNVIQFHGVVVDDNDEFVKGLLISYAEQGALIDIIYERCKEKGDGIPWAEREKWARQIVQGLSDIHESGYVQGDFTLSNIVIDDEGDAKIIDINRRGCPIGWEPPEAADLIDSNQRLSMYIGVKSDLYQLGMVLWALAMMEDEPEAHNRHPLVLAPDVDVPDWFRQMTEICLSSNPRLRLQASSLLHLFPRASPDYGIIDGPDDDSNRMDALRETSESLSDGDGSPTLNDYVVDRYQHHPNPAKRPSGSSNLWSQSNTTYADHDLMAYDDPYFEEERRGRSPPSPLPLSFEGCGGTERNGYFGSAWAANRHIPSSYSDSGEEDDGGVEEDEEPEEEEVEAEADLEEEEEEEEGSEERDREDERYSTYIPDEDFEDEHEDNGRLPLPLEIEDDSFRDPTPTPAADKMPARPASSGWLTGFGARAASDSSAQSPEAYAIEDPMFESLASPHLELPDMMYLEDLEDLYDAEAERASVRMSTYTARSDAPSERFGEAIEVKIVNLESSKNLNIIRTEGASRTRSPTKPLEQAHPHSHAQAHAHAHAHALRSPSPQRPRVVEVVSIERRQSEDSIVHVSPGPRDAGAKEHESETEPEYTTSPDHRERRARDSRTASAVELSEPVASTKQTTTMTAAKDAEGSHLSASMGRFERDGEYSDERGAEDEHEGFRTARSSALMVSTESKTR